MLFKNRFVSANLGERQEGLKVVGLHRECFHFDFAAKQMGSLLDQIGVEGVRLLSCWVHK